MTEIIPNGHFRGLGLIQKGGRIGGSRNVFVGLVGNNGDLVYPPFGGKVMNPPKGRAKMFAGDLLEYRPKTGSDRLDPEIYILRTFEVAEAADASTTVHVARGDFRHRPFPGDVLMVAPAKIGGTGAAAAVTAVTASTAQSGGAQVPVWTLTLATDLTAAKGDVLVEAEEAGTGKKMLVKAVNGVFDCDTDFLEDDNVYDVQTGPDGPVTSDFYKARYQYTPSLGGLMWIHKMSPMPKCVLDLNMCNVPGWFHVGWQINGAKAASK